MKRLRLKQGVKDVLVGIAFMGMIVIGAIILSIRVDQLNKKADTEVSAYTNVSYKTNK